MKKFITACILLSISALAYAGLITPILSNVSTVSAGAGVNMPQYPNRWLQATLNGASAVSATVNVDGSTDNSHWVTIQTFSLTAASSTLAAATVQTAPYIRGNVTAISGTGASVTLTSGE
jgi:hypothetical protein